MTRRPLITPEVVGIALALAIRRVVRFTVVLFAWMVVAFVIGASIEKPPSLTAPAAMREQPTPRIHLPAPVDTPPARLHPPGPLRQQ